MYMNIKRRKELFVSPTPEYQGKPFWSWNGKLEEKELQRQIDIMKQMGFGGYFMHSRTGLETEYLGEEWFSLTNSCADYGQKEEMESWLYDEDRWPSGIAGGIVTKEEKYRSMYLEMHIFNEETIDECKWDENVVAAFAVIHEGVIYSKERSFCIGDSLLADEVLVVFRTKYSSGDDVYNGYTYLDTMNREGVERFIEVTHEEYAKKCGDRLGRSIKGIFTDEPHRGALFSTFSEGNEKAVPYTPLLFKEFKERFGYDLKEHLLELFLIKDGERVSKVTRDYIELCQILFIENFAKPYQEWCQKNNMIFTGHVLHEDSLTAQTVMQGSLMRFYEYMDYPGIDLLAEKTNCYWVAKQVVSVARQLNKPWILSELYGCTGWQMDFEAYKHVGDWQALFGINLRCPHLSWYTMKGEAKRDYPASILHQSAWYEEYKYLEDYFSRIHVAMSQGTPDCNLLVINPIESVWARSYCTAFDGLASRDEGINKLEQQYVEVFHSLVENRIDFDYGEEDILSRHGRVEKGILYVGQSAYQKVLVAGMETVRSTTISLLNEFIKQGGEVIFAGDIPMYVDTIASKEAVKVASKAKYITLDKANIAKHCKSGNEVTIEGTNTKDIFAQVKLIEAGRMIMLLNINREEQRPDLTICLGEGEVIEEWNARTGEMYTIDAIKKDGKLYISVDFERGEEKLYMVKNNMNENIHKTEEEYINERILPNTYRYTLSEENVCVLDYVKITTDKGEIIEKQEVLKADRALRDLLQIPYRGGYMLQPWYEMKYRSSSDNLLRSLLIEYSVEIEIIPENVQLVIEDMNHVTAITVNGNTIPKAVVGKWIDICFDKVNIPSEYLVYGHNTISLQYKYYKICGIEAIYLIGDFGVSFNNDKMPVITSLPDVIELGNITEQGLPFYSGKISYLLDEYEEELVEIILDDYEGACVKAIGKEERLLAYPPLKGEVYGLKEIQLIFNRRNTFGPLHALPARAFAYGPDNFLTTGVNWTDEYVLLPQGLMKAPKIIYKK